MILLRSAVDHCDLRVFGDTRVPADTLRSMCEQRVEGLVGRHDILPDSPIDDNNAAFKAFVEALRSAVSDLLEEMDCRATLQQPAEPGYSARLREQPVSYSSAVNQILSHHRWKLATFPPVTVTS